MNPNMITESENQTAKISEIANRLADNFVKPLYNFCSEKNYYVYIGILLEIIDWAHEFYEEYRDKLGDWEAFKKSGENIDNATTPHEFLVVWGNARANKFFIINSKEYRYPDTNKDNKTSYQIEPAAKTGTAKKRLAIFKWQNLAQQQVKNLLKTTTGSAESKTGQDD